MKKRRTRLRSPSLLLIAGGPLGAGDSGAIPCLLRGTVVDGVDGHARMSVGETGPLAGTHAPVLGSAGRTIGPVAVGNGTDARPGGAALLRLAVERTDWLVAAIFVY